MKLDLRGFALAFGILWAVLILGVGLVQKVAEGYGQAFSAVAASLYPGYTADGSLGDLLVGTAYGFVDGALAGLILAWLYNVLARRAST